MKILVRVLVVFVVLILLIAVGLSVYLSKGLKPSFEKARPAIEETLGTTLEIDDLSVQVLQGRLTVDGVRLGNLEGFDAFPHLFTLAKTRNQINLGDLIFDQQVTLDEIRVEESNLYVIRKADGRTNIQALLENLQSGETPVEEEEPTPATDDPPEDETGPAELPGFLLDQFFLSSALTFLQEREDKDPLNLGIDLNVEASQIGTVGDPAEKSGSFSVRGNLAGEKDLFVLNLEGTLAPITDPLAPTFEINGQIESLEMKVFRAFTKDINLSDGMVDLRIALKADQGVFAEGSELVAHIANPEFGEGFDIPARAVPAALSVVVPVRGTVMEPAISFAEALKESVRTTVLGAPAEALKGAADELKGEAEARAEALKQEAAAKREALQSEAKEQSSRMLENAKSGSLDLEGSKKSLGGMLGGSSSEEDGDEKPATSGLLEKPKSGLGGFLGGGDAEESAPEEGPSDAEPETDTDPEPSGDAVEEAKKGIGGMVPGFGGGQKDSTEPEEKKKSPLKGLF